MQYEYKVSASRDQPSSAPWRAVWSPSFCCALAASTPAPATKKKKRWPTRCGWPCPRPLPIRARPILQFSDIKDRINYLYWRGEMSERLKSKLPDLQVRQEFLHTVWYEAKRAGLDPQMVLGLIQVESGFHKYAVSPVGARGYMQVMPFWTRTIGDGDPQKLFDMQTNLRYGCSVLRMYIDREAGDLYLALGRYNGSRGQAEYPNAVRAAWKKWDYKE